MGHAARAAAHVGQDDGRAGIQIVEEAVQPLRRVHVDLRDVAAKEVRQAAARFVLGVQIQQGHRNALVLIPLGQSTHEVRLADATLAAHRHDDALPDRLRVDLDCAG